MVREAIGVLGVVSVRRSVGEVVEEVLGSSDNVSIDVTLFLKDEGGEEQNESLHTWTYNSSDDQGLMPEIRTATLPLNSVGGLVRELMGPSPSGPRERQTDTGFEIVIPISRQHRGGKERNVIKRLETFEDLGEEVVGCVRVVVRRAGEVKGGKKK